MKHQNTKHAKRLSVENNNIINDEYESALRTYFGKLFVFLVELDQFCKKADHVKEVKNMTDQQLETLIDECDEKFAEIYERYGNFLAISNLQLLRSWATEEFIRRRNKE